MPNTDLELRNEAEVGVTDLRVLSCSSNNGCKEQILNIIPEETLLF